MKPYRTYRRRMVPMGRVPRTIRVGSRHTGKLALGLAVILTFSLLLSQEAGATLLTYNSKYVTNSATAVTTTSDTFVDDTQASNTFSLAAGKTVLVVYSPHNANGDTEWQYGGREFALSIDGTDRAHSWATGNGGNYPDGVTTFWIGTLGSGSHTLKGRFRTQTSGQTVTIAERVLIIYILDGDEYQYIDNATDQTTTSSSFVNDASASATFTPSASCKALILYNSEHAVGDTGQGADGKKIAIGVNGVDYSQADKGSGQASCYGENVFTLHYTNLSAVSCSVTGRFACAGSSYQADTARRQLGILLFADSTLADYITSDTQVSTSSAYPQDDGQATINRTTSDSRELLAIAMGTKRGGTSSADHGEAYGIKVNSNDRAKSRASADGSTGPNSASTVWAETLSSASHTIQGRYGNNTGSETAKIDSRRVVALWLSTTPGATAPTVNNDNGASGVTSSSATLNGNLTSTGGVPTTAYIYWGTSDGGTTQAAWGHTNNFGVLPTGAFSNQVSSLSMGTLYYYRCFATNSAGGAWASSSTNFTTQTLNGPVMRFR